MRIIKRKINDLELSFYIELFMLKYKSWYDEYDVSAILSKNEFAAFSEYEITEKISSLPQNKLLSELDDLGLIPEEIYHIEDEITGISSSLPIYTSINQVDNDGGGSVIAKAFFGNETHLLNNCGEILFEEIYNK